jgi:hypothetical protein
MCPLMPARCYQSCARAGDVASTAMTKSAWAEDTYLRHRSSSATYLKFQCLLPWSQDSTDKFTYSHAWTMACAHATPPQAAPGCWLRRVWGVRCRGPMVRAVAAMLMPSGGAGDADALRRQRASGRGKRGGIQPGRAGRGHRDLDAAHAEPHPVPIFSSLKRMVPQVAVANWYGAGRSGGARRAAGRRRKQTPESQLVGAHGRR